MGLLPPSADNSVMATFSAGILVYRYMPDNSVQVLLAHPGGPFWARKDTGAWSIPKGEYQPGQEQPVAAARREFSEELGLPAPEGPMIPLESVRLSSGKTITAWAVEAEIDPSAITPGTFEMQWPPRSGKVAEFPEIDRVEWFDLPTARTKLSTGQLPFLDRLAAHLAT